MSFELPELPELIRLLSQAPGPSGFEQPAAEVLLPLLRPLVDEVRTDPAGNVIGIRRCGKPGAATLLIDAHLDEVGFVITGRENGLFRFDRIGGIDARILPGQEVTVLTPEPVCGVIVRCKNDGAESELSACAASDLRIDIGADADGENRICVGTPAVFRRTFLRLGQDRIASNAMDNRSCVAVGLRTLQLLKDKTLSINTVFLASIQEETDSAGAVTAVWGICPDYAAVLDTTHAATPDSEKEDTFPLGGGPVIGVGPNISRGLAALVERCAEEEQIAFSREILPGDSGTNGWDIQVSREGVATVLISLPLRYMHTPHEVISLTDAENTARLLAAAARKLGGEGI